MRLIRRGKKQFSREIEGILTKLESLTRNATPLMEINARSLLALLIHWLSEQTGKNMALEISSDPLRVTVYEAGGGDEKKDWYTEARRVGECRS